MNLISAFLISLSLPAPSTFRFIKKNLKSVQNFRFILWLSSTERRKLLFLLMPILPQAFFPFVGSHFMSFSFLSAGHGDKLLVGTYFTWVLTLFTKVFAGLKAGML